MDISDTLPSPGEAMGSLAASDLWAAIERELHDPRFDMCTYQGLARRLNVSVEEVQAVVAQHPDSVRFSWMPSRDGHPMFTLATKPKNWRERVSEIRYLFASLA